MLPELDLAAIERGVMQAFIAGQRAPITGEFLEWGLAWSFGDRLSLRKIFQRTSAQHESTHRWLESRRKESRDAVRNHQP